MGRLLIGLCLASSACGAPPVPEVAQHTARCGDDPNDKERPMVVEWSAADRAALEAESEHGIVVVAYHAEPDGSACSLRVLGECTIDGNYEMTPTTPARDFIHMKSESELRAALPLAAASFGGEVSAGSELRLDYVVVGQRRASVRSLDASAVSGSRCSEATHFVRAMIIGASKLSAMSEQAASAEASGFGASASASSSSESRELRTNGDLDDCRDPGGGGGCTALIQLDLTPLEQSASSGTSGGETPLEAPDGARIEQGTLAEGDERLQSGEHVDSYSVDVSAGANLFVAVESGDFDTYLIVRGPNGEQHDNDDQPGRGTNSGLVVAGAAAGTWTVRVTSYSPGETGAYRLAIDGTSGASGSSGTSGSGGGEIASNFGTVSLTPGFTPDPHRAEGTSGGPTDASELDSSCRGFISRTPDHVLQVTDTFDFLRMYVESDTDTTLVVQTPGGSFACNDDRWGSNPGLDAAGGQLTAGAYRIWVGSYSAEESGDYRLSFTEVPDNEP